MKVTVCELRNSSLEFDADWQALVNHVRSESSDLVLLPEMPFYPWVAWTREVHPSVWKSSVEVHVQRISCLADLGSSTVISSRPIIENTKHFNEGYVWEVDSGYRPAHTKYYLPNEEGFWEALWYQRGAKEFEAIQTSKAKVGFLICTELWFNSHARQYAEQKVDLLVCPRATPAQSTDKWIAGGRTAAVVSGAYCLSSNFSGGGSGESEFGGTGWIIEPEEGEVLGVTSRRHPFLTLEIDLSKARKAKQTYPRYVAD